MGKLSVAPSSRDERFPMFLTVFCSLSLYLLIVLLRRHFLSLPRLSLLVLVLDLYPSESRLFPSLSFSPLPSATALCPLFDHPSIVRSFLPDLVYKVNDLYPSSVAFQRDPTFTQSTSPESALSCRDTVLPHPVRERDTQSSSREHGTVGMVVRVHRICGLI